MSTSRPRASSGRWRRPRGDATATRPPPVVVACRVLFVSPLQSCGLGGAPARRAARAARGPRDRSRTRPRPNAPPQRRAPGACAGRAARCGAASRLSAAAGSVLLISVSVGGASARCVESSVSDGVGCGAGRAVGGGARCVERMSRRAADPRGTAYHIRETCAMFRKYANTARYTIIDIRYSNELRAGGRRSQGGGGN